MDNPFSTAYATIESAFVKFITAGEFSSTYAFCEADWLKSEYAFISLLNVVLLK